MLNSENGGVPLVATGSHTINMTQDAVAQLLSQLNNTNNVTANLDVPLAEVPLPELVPTFFHITSAVATELGRATLPATVRSRSTSCALSLEQQVEDIAAGIPLSNRIAVDRLTASRQKTLKDALKAVAIIPELVRSAMFAN